MNWAILEYETGRHTAIPTSLCRLGIPCIIPMVEDFSLKDKRKITRPALPRLLFMPGVETQIRMVLDRIRYAEKVWRDSRGDLIVVPDHQLQPFLDGLEKREKKAKATKKAINLGEAAERDWFTLYVHLYGRQEAIRRFGRDMARDAA